MIDSCITKILHGVAVCLVATCSAADARTPTSSDHIAAALVAAGLQVRADQIEVLSSTGPACTDTGLTVLSVSNWREGMKKARLRCKENSDCVPFYVILHRANTLEIPPQFLKQTKDAAGPKPAIKTSSIVVRGGQAATLILQNADMQITLRVRCLQNGKRGDHIRVVGSETKRIYRAEVMETGLLRGIL